MFLHNYLGKLHNGYFVSGRAKATPPPLLFFILILFLVDALLSLVVLTLRKAYCLQLLLQLFFIKPFLFRHEYGINFRFYFKKIKSIIFPYIYNLGHSNWTQISNASYLFYLNEQFGWQHLLKADIFSLYPRKFREDV